MTTKMSTEWPLIKNVAKCLKCEEIIESKHRHNFVSCKCGNLFVDGGLEYTRRGFRDGPDTWEELSEFNDEEATTT
jgi:hypothetical protein